MSLLVAALDPRPGMAQVPTEIVMPEVSSTYEFRKARAVETEVHSAILSKTEDEVRDGHIERALELAREFVEAEPNSAEANFWMAISLGLKTEYSGPFAKLTTGKESFEFTQRALELDPDHAASHELLGRIHAGVMRLPWLVRKLGASMGMSEVLGDASWETAEASFARSAELDPGAIGPRLELGKLLEERDRPEEGRLWLHKLLEITPGNDLDRAMQAEARELLEEWGQ